ncbi:hypothetical protein BATDEDRAFT_92745 [Batrachochytrium dendrobatidis JAM81]|uniref:Uncharacterized protein n=1 Tax=Batrachochytrium dendrobatidis (strain JAM81 / FGSC 10211) TaxID=684364 RepID=F4PED2_BATDJ|nr:uncharacterized protein BATDEDRAFT_92745 [Batrachochytrium dendrobatidis JAM81]EGF76406.1 hypothetical protein BATDEDRAFT_92745 [Batrachochytrium dendrobatidis JAM81]|eukprot:XP_006683014.1 hypothetical protein BATDEDRAFT_92745 [Batrachochytrium dendrobatidis JAM81]
MIQKSTNKAEMIKVFRDYGIVKQLNTIISCRNIRLCNSPVPDIVNLLKTLADFADNHPDSSIRTKLEQGGMFENLTAIVQSNTADHRNKRIAGQIIETCFQHLVHVANSSIWPYDDNAEIDMKSGMAGDTHGQVRTLVEMRYIQYLQSQSTVDPNDSDNSVKQSKQSNESSSSSQSEQSDDNDCSFFNSHISKNEQSSLTPRQKLDRIERMMRKIGMDIPTGAEDTRKIDAEVKQRVQETKKKGHIMAPSDRRNLMRLKLERSWICYNLELESFNEMSINAVSEPTPETSESTSKPHGSKQGFFKTHQSKSNRQENQSTLSAWKLKLKIKKPKLPKLTVYSKSMFGN